jgi:hypothetical protein
VNNSSEEAGPGVGFSPLDAQAAAASPKTAPVSLEDDDYKRWRTRATSGAPEAIGGRAAPSPGPGSSTSAGQVAGEPFGEPSPEVAPEPSQPQEAGPGAKASRRKQR